MSKRYDTSIDIYNEILISHKEEEKVTICNNVDGS